MSGHNTFIYLLIAIVVTNLLRIIPVTVFRKKITNRFVRSFLHYVPYVTLSVMTVPAIIYATESPVAGLISLAAGIVAAWFGLGLFSVSLICCVSVYLCQLFII